jgi:translation initiation factor 1
MYQILRRIWIRFQGASIGAYLLYMAIDATDENGFKDKQDGYIIKWGLNCIMNNSRLVYSTEKGRVCPNCGNPVKKCQCKKGKTAFPRQSPGDGILRIRREVKGRKGKGVTTITGLDMDAEELKAKAAGLKRLCGTGGSIKEGVVIIQGDHRNTLLAELRRQGYNVKLAGG